MQGVRIEGGKWVTGWSDWFVVEDASHPGKFVLAGDEFGDPDNFELIARSK